MPQELKTLDKKTEQGCPLTGYCFYIQFYLHRPTISLSQSGMCAGKSNFEECIAFEGLEENDTLAKEIIEDWRSQ